MTLTLLHKILFMGIKKAFLEEIKKTIAKVNKVDIKEGLNLSRFIANF